MQTVWEHDGESTVVETSGVSSLNHDLTGSDIEALGSGYSAGEKWQWQRDSKVGALESINLVNADAPDRWKSTTASTVSGTSRGSGHQLENVMVDQTNYDLSYDQAGRTTAALGMTMTWGPQGRLQAISDANGLIEAYLYDADGRLTAIMDGSTNVKETFVYDGDQIIAAFDGSGHSLWEAVWGARQDQLVLWQDISGGDDGYIPLTDHRRSIVGTWSKNGERMDELARYTP